MLVHLYMYGSHNLIHTHTQGLKWLSLAENKKKSLMLLCCVRLLYEHFIDVWIVHILLTAYLVDALESLEFHIANDFKSILNKDTS